MKEQHQFALGIATFALAAVSLAILVSLSKQVKEALPVAGPAAENASAPTPKSAKLSLTYDDAVETFAYRFQFTDCHGTPGNINLAKGAVFMLDNRDAKTRVVMVGQQKYTLGAYAFALAHVNTKGDYQITCDGGGAATLRVE